MRIKVEYESGGSFQFYLGKDQTQEDRLAGLQALSVITNEKSKADFIWVYDDAAYGFAKDMKMEAQKFILDRLDKIENV